MVETASVAYDIWGPKLYHERARRALPILVAQAKARQPIQYNKIARELDMSNARNMNYILGSIGKSLIDLGKERQEDIPLIQALVVTKNTGLPGPGIEGFFDEKERYSRLNSQDRTRLVDDMLKKAYFYEHWDEVLNKLDLTPLKLGSIDGMAKSSSGGRGGEGKAHKELKAYILAHPALVGLKSVIHSEDEKNLLSGDSIDVFFETRKVCLGVEVKSRVSKESDMIRGIYQCVKYKAVMEAEAAIESNTKSIDAVLVLETSMTPMVVSIANRLGIEVVENCVPH